MRKRIIGDKCPYFTYIFLFLIIQLCNLPGRSLAVVLHSESDRGLSSGHSQQVHHIPWVDLDVDFEGSEIGLPLSRDRRSANGTIGSKSVWEKIEEFYSDKNNMAMFCVLPILILIYGGCSSIYCIHKCRQYLKGRKHKRLKDEDCGSMNTRKAQTQRNNKANRSLNDDRERPVSQISSAWTDLQVDTSESGWSAQTEGEHLGTPSFSPLPWQVPSSEDAVAAPVQNSRQINGHKENRSCDVILGGIMQTDDVTDKENRINMILNQAKKSGLSVDVAAQDIKHQTPPHPASRPDVPVRGIESQPFEETRTHVNFADYTTNKSTTLKAADYSRFSDSRSIEIIPLTADPYLRSSEEGKGQSRDRREIPMLAGVPTQDITRETAMTALALKEDMLAKYDAMSTFQMAKKAAEILNSDTKDKNPRKLTSKRHIFITD